MNKFPGFPKKEKTNFWSYPKILNGYYHLLTTSEQSVLWYLLRHTWGWQKEEDSISLNQFKHGIQNKNTKKWVDKGIGIKDDGTILRALNSLEKKGFITISREKGMVNKYKLQLLETVETSGKIQEVTPKTSGKIQEVTSGKIQDTINNSTINNNKINGETKVSPTRKEFRISPTTYKEITDAYQKYKGIELKGAEFGQIKQAIKTMLYSGRTKENILDFMKFCAEVCQRISEGDKEVENRLGWFQNWTLLTIKRKMPEFLKGQFKIEDEELEVPSYFKNYGTNK